MTHEKAHWTAIGIWNAVLSALFPQPWMIKAQRLTSVAYNVDLQLPNSNVQVDSTRCDTSQLQWRHLDSIRRRCRGKDTGCETIDEFTEEPHDVLLRNDEEFQEDSTDGDNARKKERSTATHRQRRTKADVP